MGASVSGSGQAAAIDLAVAGFPAGLIVHARITPAPADTDVPNGVWIEYTLRVRGDHDYVRGCWQADVSSGVVREQSERRGWTRVVGQSIVLNLPDGSKRCDSERSLTTAFEGTVEHWSEPEIHACVDKAAAEAGCSIKHIRFPCPLGFVAAEVTLVREDADAYQRARNEALGTMLTTLLADSARVEGVLLVIEDPDGVTLLRRGDSVRLRSTIRTDL